MIILFWKIDILRGIFLVVGHPIIRKAAIAALCMSILLPSILAFSMGANTNAKDRGTYPHEQNMNGPGALANMSSSQNNNPFMYPSMMAFDPHNGFLYATNMNNSFLFAYNSSTQEEVASVHLNSTDGQVAFNPANGYIYAEYGKNTVSAIDPSSETIIANLPVGAVTHYAFDPANGFLYADTSNNITVIGKNNTIVDIIDISDGFSAFNSGNVNYYENYSAGITYDSTNQLIYAVGGQSGNLLYTINSTNNITGVFKTAPDTAEICYNPANNYIYGLQQTTYPPHPDPHGGIYATQYPNNITLIKPSNGFFTTILNFGHSLYKTPLFGDMVYDPADGNIYLTMLLSGVSATTFARPTYDIISISHITNNYTNSDAKASETFNNLLGPGIAYDSLNQEIYAVNYSTPDPGRIFELSGIYNITFRESGLPQGSLWYVNMSLGFGISLQSSTQSNAVKLPNGSYHYTISVANKSFKYAESTSYIGALSVHGHSETVNVSFMPAVFLVTLTESGIPDGYQWYINIDSGGWLGPISNSSYDVHLTNGTYYYSAYYIFSLENKTVSSNGSFNVTGVLNKVLVNFSFPSPHTHTLNLSTGGVKLYTFIEVSFLVSTVSSMVYAVGERHKRNRK